jgi:NhaP-type Na+/H+ or K+/H+ antiporter
VTDNFFGIDSYHVLMAIAGVSILLAYWLPRLVHRDAPASPALFMYFGALGFSLVPGMPAFFDPTTMPHIWERISEAVLIVVLFATGLRIDNVPGYRLWLPTVRLLAIAMPLTIAAIALLGWSLAGMTIGGAVLLGAALAPTDPVLAGNLQVGPPMEGGEHPARFALTSEAGLNDGLAFPFVYLGLLIAADGGDVSSWFSDWLLRDVFYRTIVGVAGGIAIGWLLGKVLFAIPTWNTLARTGPGVVALAGVLLCYGLVELAEGYGFLAVFFAGLVCRRAEQQHEFHRRLHAFSESIENAVTAILLILLGGTLPHLWPALDWRHSVIGFGLIFVIRPLSAWISLQGTKFQPTDKAMIAFFGVRGVGSIYYLGYASTQVQFVNETQLWALVGFTIFASTVIHGLTSPFVLSRLSVPPSVPRQRDPTSDS